MKGLGEFGRLAAMNTAARKWDELWTSIQAMQDPERLYVLSRIKVDMTTVVPVSHEALKRTTQD